MTRVAHVHGHLREVGFSMRLGGGEPRAPEGGRGVSKGAQLTTSLISHQLKAPEIFSVVSGFRGFSG